MSADNIQIGGDHYKDGGRMQHWNTLVLLGYSWEYYVGNATKYATRYMKKAGAQDVQKAIHYTEKLVELVETGVLPQRFRTAQGFRLNLDPKPGNYGRNVDTEQLVIEYCKTNGVISDNACRCINSLFCACLVEDLYQAMEYLRALYDEVLGIEPPKAEPPPTAAQAATKAAQDAAQALGAEAGPDYVNQDYRR